MNCGTAIDAVGDEQRSWPVPKLATLGEPLPKEPTVQWKKGWTPWGTPCSVLIIDGLAYAAHAIERQDCPLARVAED